MAFLPQLSEKDRAVFNSIFSPTLPYEDVIEETCYTEGEGGSHHDDDTKEMLDLELSAIRSAEKKDYAESLLSFEKLLEMNPKRAATYNNRAQVHRLSGNTDGAYHDLNKAIEYGEGNGRILRQAYCQRGILRRKDGKDAEAKEDFAQSAKLGSPFAKQQLIEMNPYAALCNEMLVKAMKELK